MSKNCLARAEMRGNNREFQLLQKVEKLVEQSGFNLLILTPSFSAILSTSCPLRTAPPQGVFKPKDQPGNDTIGLDSGPSTLAVVPSEGDHTWSSSVRNCAQICARSADCNASAAPTTRTTTTSGAKSRSTANVACTGTTAAAIRRRAAAMPPRNASCQRTARACTANWSMTWCV